MFLVLEGGCLCGLKFPVHRGWGNEELWEDGSEATGEKQSKLWAGRSGGDSRFSPWKEKHGEVFFLV